MTLGFKNVVTVWQLLCALFCFDCYFQRIRCAKKLTTRNCKFKIRNTFPYTSNDGSLSSNNIFALTFFNRFNESGVVTFHIGSIPTSVFCHVGDFGCGDGAWTSVLKIDGNKVYIYLFIKIIGRLLSLPIVTKMYFLSIYANVFLHLDNSFECINQWSLRSLRLTLSFKLFASRD